MQIDVTGWEQEKINMIHSMAAQILWQQGVNYDDIKVIDGTIELSNPSSDVSKILTADTITTAYDAWKVLNDAAIAEAIIEEQKIQAERQTNVLVQIKYDDIDAPIDAIKTLDDAKEYLKTLTKFIKTRQ